MSKADLNLKNRIENCDVKYSLLTLRKSNGIELRNVYFQPYGSFSRKFLSEVEKCVNRSSIQVLPNQVSKKSFYMFEDIDLRESHAKLHKKLSETLGADSI